MSEDGKGCIDEKPSDVDSAEKAKIVARMALCKFTEQYSGDEFARQLKLATLQTLCGLEKKGYNMNRYFCEMFDIIRRQDYGFGRVMKSYEEKARGKIKK